MNRVLILAGLTAGLALGQGPKSILIITDAEGVGGICRQSQTDPTSSELQKLLTGEVNASVRGFREAGAADIVVWDAHDSSRTLSTLTIDPGVKLVMGALGPSILLDRKFSAVAFVGQHARANRERGVMAHSYSSEGIQRILLNGKEVGEIETRAAVAGWFDTPVIFLSGDRAATEDLLAIVPNAEVAVVKEGLGYYACVSLSAEAAQALIQQKAAAAWRKLASVRPYKVSGPVDLVIELTTRNSSSRDKALPPGVAQTDPRTLRYSGKDFWEAWSRWVD